jgi:hypothetical protein
MIGIIHILSNSTQHPQIRAAYASTSGQVKTLEAHIDEAMRKYGIAESWSALALHSPKDVRTGRISTGRKKLIVARGTRDRGPTSTYARGRMHGPID